MRQRNEVDQQLSDEQLRLTSLMNEIAAAQREHAEARSTLTRLEGELARLRREAEVSHSELEAIHRALVEMEELARKLAAQFEPPDRTSRSAGHASKYSNASWLSWKPRSAVQRPS